MNIVAEISVVPLGTSSPSVSTYVVNALKVLEGFPKVRYQLAAMGTQLEGEWDDIMAASKAMHESVFKTGALRVVTTLKLDERRDKFHTIESKVHSVEDNK